MEIPCNSRSVQIASMYTLKCRHSVEIATESQREKCVFKLVVQRLELGTSTVHPKPLEKSPGVFRSQQAAMFELLEPMQAESVRNNQHIALNRTSSGSPSSPDRGRTFQIRSRNLKEKPLSAFPRHLIHECGTYRIPATLTFRPVMSKISD